jgi:hypothetical protein
MMHEADDEAMRYYELEHRRLKNGTAALEHNFTRLRRDYLLVRHLKSAGTRL